MKKTIILQFFIMLLLTRNCISQINNEEKVMNSNRLSLKDDVNISLDSKILKKSTITLDGKILKAYNVAFENFKKEKFNLINYEVMFEQDNKTLIINFIPISTYNELLFSTGGRNSSGEGINYRVSLYNYKIIEIWGSR